MKPPYQLPYQLACQLPRQKLILLCQQPCKVLHQLPCQQLRQTMQLQQIQMYALIQPAVPQPAFVHFQVDWGLAILAIIW